uniref:DDE Tnp4 domain-containing protein n=1 Tax=Caenorhabditis japonica TaxID=281687 RepID=A0A2Q4QQN1_CAEJA
MSHNCSNQKENRKTVALAFLLAKQRHITITSMLGLVNDPCEHIAAIRADALEQFKRKVDILIDRKQYKYITGVDEKTFNTLLTIIEPRGSYIGLSPIARLVVFLRYAREGDTQNRISRDIGVSQATISRLLSDVIWAIANVAPEHIIFPSDRKEIMSQQYDFFHKTNCNGVMRKMPCFGLIDGKHWATEHPPHTGSLNYNYKGFYSFNSLVVCDANSRINFIQVSELAVNSDAALFRDGPLAEMLDSCVTECGYTKIPGSDIEMPPFLLADNGFGLNFTVMNKYRTIGITTEKIRFNEWICQTRVKVENCFGILTSKFKVFRRRLNLKPATSRALIVALACVHNISLGPRHIHSLPADIEPINHHNPYRSPEEQRDMLMRFFLEC